MSRPRPRRFSADVTAFRRSPFAGFRRPIGRLPKNLYVITAALLTCGLLSATFVSVSPARAAQDPVSLGAAADFAVLAATTVTAGTSSITGDLGVSPGTAVTGFPPSVVNNGSIHSADAAAINAQSGAHTAYDTLSGQTPTQDVGTASLATVGPAGSSNTLTPGVYSSTSSLELTGTLKLDALDNPDAVFVFQAGSTLGTAASSAVELINGAQASNVFWQVGSSATLGANSTFAGTILAHTSVDTGANVSVTGRLLALGGAVTMGASTNVTMPAATQWRTHPLPVNSCHDQSLPIDHGTNFPTPSDPNGYGFQNQSAIGWENNFYPVFTYLSGSYFARGVPAVYSNGTSKICGGMYSFGVYNYGLDTGKAPAAGSVTWAMADGYLPALTTAFTRNNVHISITNFADNQFITGHPAGLVYTRVQVENRGSNAVTVSPGASGQGLVELTPAGDGVAPGATVNHDFVAAVDPLSLDTPLPAASAVAKAEPYQAAYAHMRDYWQDRLSVIPRLSLPNVALANTNGLKNPGTSMQDAYRAAFVYTRIVQVDAAPFSAANSYAWLLNHDVPGLLLNKFALNDFKDAHQLLLSGRASEEPGFNELGANWYWDGLWATPGAWAKYLAKSGDVAFVRKYFHDDANGTSPYGPSLYTIMHTDYLTQLGSSGYLKASNDNDSFGTWLFDDEAALAGLASYKYIATQIGDASEATWADAQYNSLLTATNKALAANQSSYNFSYLPCEVNTPLSQDRCGNPTDANWASANMWNQNVWSIRNAGGVLNGVLGDPSQTDNLYQYGFARLAGKLPFPTFGAFSGYSTAYNTSYSEGALYGNTYRDLPITSYAWQIATTTGGPNAWWEANGSAPDPKNPWAGSHAGPQFGAVPYAWPMAGQTDTLLQSIVSERQVAQADGHGGFSYQTALDIGRGLPDAWITPGQSVSVDNITTAVPGVRRGTYGVQIKTTAQDGDRLVHVTVTPSPPGNDINVNLPALLNSTVKQVRGGQYDPNTHTVKMNGRDAEILLGAPNSTTVSVNAQSIVNGSPQPVLNAGSAATVSAKVTNTGKTTLDHVGLTPDLPQGWTAKAESAITPTTLAPGASATATWSVTPADNATGGSGLRVIADYQGDGLSLSTSGMQYVVVQRPLPVPPGASDLALTATPSASYTSPWEHVTAINDGIYPPSSNDSQNFRWGTWPQQGVQWIELDWSKPTTMDASSLYFFSDGGGVQAPASWQLQYWNGTKFVAVSNPSSYTTTLNQFNPVTFDQITTTQLRAVLTSGEASVGALEWLAYQTK